MGKSGNAGPRGLQGPQGIRGNDGMGLTFRDFKVQSSYSRGNYVFAKSTKDSTQDSMYIAQKNIPSADKLPSQDLTSGNWIEFKAATGATGINGKDGATGATGDRGLQGNEGQKGERGMKGDQGIQGMKGNDGQKG